MSDDNFDWGPTNRDVIVPEQRSVAIYVNPWGQAVIRQERAWDEEDDKYLCISKEFLPGVIKALKDIVESNPQRDDPEELKRAREAERKTEAERRTKPAPDVQ